MFKASADRLTTPASSRTVVPLCGAINRKAMEQAQFLLWQTSLANANAEGIGEEERTHHLHVAQRVTIESAVFTSRGRRYSFSTVGKRT